MEISWENNHVDHLHTKAPPQMFHRTPNVPLIEGAVNVGCGWTALEYRKLGETLIRIQGV